MSNNKLKDKKIINLLCQNKINKLSKTLKTKSVSSPEEIKNFDFDIILYDPTYHYSPSWQRVFIHCIALGKKILSIWELEEILEKRISIDLLHDDWLDKGFKINKRYLKIKKILDIFLILLFSPIILFLYAIISVSILISMGFPIIFKQKRVGLNGRIFTLYKFRSMTLEHSGDETSGKKDPRITKLGKILRKYRLDEITQIWNVLKGDMSIIGPRPETPDLTAKYLWEINCYRIRQKVKPGITGWAQVKQGYAVGTDGSAIKICYDLFYIKHLSLFLDIKIIFLTIKTLLTGKGAI